MQVIGFLQMFLTTMAFKNDISFFKGRKDYTGLSSRSLATDTLQELIIFLYLFDYEDISRIVLFQVGASSAISAWKYVRVSRLNLGWQYLLPWLKPTRGGLSDNQSEQDTEEIDAKGMRYLSWIMYPLSACWGLYNLHNYAYKSWWSWLVSSLADFAYTFGFINMMPQIFINYKLKSVAHMPWRVLAYKFFNTFIDDVFAFFIMSDYMTKKHRFMTLRDDVVFFIFMYQRHLYKVDPTRPDEFGFVYGDDNAPTREVLEDDPEVLTARINVAADRSEVLVQTWSAAGEMMEESSFPAEAALPQLESKVRSGLRPVWEEVSFISDDGTVVEKDAQLKNYTRLTMRGHIKKSVPYQREGGATAAAISNRDTSHEAVDGGSNDQVCERAGTAQDDAS